MRKLWLGHVSIGKALVICLGIGSAVHLVVAPLLTVLSSSTSGGVLWVLLMIAAIVLTGISSVGLWRSTVQQAGSPALKLAGKIASVLMLWSAAHGICLMLLLGFWLVVVSWAAMW